MKRPNRLLRIFAAVFPKSYRDNMQQLLDWSRATIDADTWLGLTLIWSLSILTFLLVLGNATDSPTLYVMAPVGVLTFAIIALSKPYFDAERNAEEVEEILPSFLQLMSANIRSGMNPYLAIKHSARDEFGILKDEIEVATVKSLGSGSFAEALYTIGSKFNSHILNRFLRLFIKSIESGSELSKLLEETSKDIRENLMLRHELISTTKTYTSLILFSVLIAAPFLMNVSIIFTERLASLRETIDVSQVEDLGMDMLVGSDIPAEFLINISLITISGTSFIASLLMGVIVKGKEKYGLKYAFATVPLSIIIFYIIRYAAKSLFS